MPGSEFPADAIASTQPIPTWSELAPTDATALGADLLAVAAYFSAIEALIDAGRPADARESASRLIYAFQPVIVGDAGLFATTLDLLDRCAGHGLRRLLTRASGQVEPKAII